MYVLARSLSILSAKGMELRKQTIASLLSSPHCSALCLSFTRFDGQRQERLVTSRATYVSEQSRNCVK